MFEHQLLPPIFRKYFKLTENVHSHSTRQSSDLYLPLLYYESSRKSIKYAGVILWNKIPKEIKRCPSLASFKKSYKKYLIDAYK